MNSSYRNVSLSDVEDFTKKRNYSQTILNFNPFHGFLKQKNHLRKMVFNNMYWQISIKDW